MLACKAPPLEDIRVPLIGSPKLDGIRCTIQNGVALSRTLKPLPQPTLQKFFSDGRFDGFDGEITVGEHDEKVFARTTSFCMSKTEKHEDWIFNVFDCFLDAIFKEPFFKRIELTNEDIGRINDDKVVVVPHHQILTPEALLEYEQECLIDGYEGVMIRSVDGPYKNGRSTAKEGYLMKLKQFEDGEALIIGYEERMHNENEAQTNELGRTSRSTCKDGMVPAGDLGAWIVINKEGVEFKVGSGYSADERKELWEIRDYLVKDESYLKYRFFPQGIKDKPRFPTYLGLRDKIDFD